MAKDRKKLLHIHSSIPDKQPTAASIEVGEIAVNNAANQEFLSIKNSNNKIKRFSSDEQLITWMEKKEVMPYEGYTRGSDGPAGATGPDSVTNDDLLQNKSNLIIKLNQVAATNTVKHDKVNGAKDIYGKCVNPTSDSGVTDGAGFAIDMSRYAMIGANPSFSSLTVTDKTDLSGNTTIANGDGTRTRTGHTLTIKTTDVTANDTNWTETITNRTSTVTNETDKITTLNASATTANVSGNTLVLQEATSISAKTPTAYLSGTTLDVKETNTDITSCGRISANTNDFEVKQCAANGKFIVNSDDADVSGKTLDIIENTSVTVKTPAASVSGATLVADESTSISAKTPTAYLSGTTLNVKETNTDIQSCGRISANTNAFTVQECAAGSGKTVINQTDIKASGKTLSFDETTSISAKTPTTTLSGTNLNVTETTSTINSTNTNLTGTNLNISETNTTINSCGKVEITTDKYTLKQCSTSGGTAEFEFCNDYTVKSNAINLQQCGTAGTISIASQTQNINGGSLTVNESGNTAINTNGTTNIKSTGSTNIETNGANNKVTIQASGNGGDVEVFAKDTLCTSGGTTAAFVGATKTNIGMNCADAGNTAALNVRGVTTNISAGTITQTTSGNTTINVGGALTENVTGATTENHGGAVTINNSNGLTSTTTGNTCITASGNLTMGGDGNTNIGYNCAGTGIANNVNIYASTGVTVNAPTTNITGNTNISGNTVVKGTTNISGATTIGGATTINNNLTVTGNTNISGNTVVKGTLDSIGGLTKSVTWALGTPSADTTGYNGSANKTITIPSSTSHLTKSTLTIDYNTDVRNKADASYNTEAAATVSIPGSIDHLSNYDGTNITLPHPVLVSGTVTASGAIYSSDRNLKENIDFVEREKINKVKNIFAKSYNFKSDESKTKTYGVIAQDVQEAGLPELVHITDDKGTLGVDYTSLFILKIAYLEDFCAMLNGRIVELENRIKELENKD